MSDLSRHYHWVERSRAYDVESYRLTNYQAVTEFQLAIIGGARQAVLALLKVKPRTYEAAIDGIVNIAKVLPPEILVNLFGAATAGGTVVVLENDPREPNRPYPNDRVA